ncbi:YidH family protein [Hoyosella subflava]|uniref:Hypothetical membrane protein n=1 Tax=Hoyosella subflava (strain DSM 45089 / JCM 17490 / NBRC 109087 / DQS3-9A1) TaxID=443218 RepID=F6EKV3_HOYSD|nr:DUF202 domain-containing protein [Hoyosella subflava]AEF41432.1 Hypothetical membrane protein [Hoyosella subflava DQS3-9A1]
MSAPLRPDERFTLASERTFLAWMRTSLGLMVAGIAVIHVVPTFSTQTVRTVIGLAMVSLSCLAAAEGFRRWRQVAKALESGEEEMPGPRTLAIITVAIVAVGVATLIAIGADLVT